MARLSGSMISGSPTTERVPWAQCQKVITKKNSNFSNNSFCLLPKKKKKIQGWSLKDIGARVITISREGGKRGIHPFYGHVHTLIYDQVGWRIIALMIWGTKKFSEINFHRNFRAAEQMILSLGTYHAPCTVLSIAQEDVPSTILWLFLRTVYPNSQMTPPCLLPSKLSDRCI